MKGWNSNQLGQGVAEIHANAPGFCQHNGAFILINWGIKNKNKQANKKPPQHMLINVVPSMGAWLYPQESISFGLSFFVSPSRGKSNFLWCKKAVLSNRSGLGHLSSLGSATSLLFGLAWITASLCLSSPHQWNRDNNAALFCKAYFNL